MLFGKNSISYLTVYPCIITSLVLCGSFKVFYLLYYLSIRVYPLSLALGLLTYFFDIVIVSIILFFVNDFLKVFYFFNIFLLTKRQHNKLFFEGVKRRTSVRLNKCSTIGEVIKPCQKVKRGVYFGIKFFWKLKMSMLTSKKSPNQIFNSKHGTLPNHFFNSKYEELYFYFP